MSGRDAVRAARRDVHADRAIPANYYSTPTTPTPVLIGVRLSHKFLPMGNVSMREHLSEIADVQPELIFMRDEIEPVRNAIVVLTATEAYRIEATDEPDDLTRKAVVSALTPAQAASYTSPE